MLREFVNIIGRNPSIVIPLLANQDLTPMLVPYTFVRRGVPVREDTYPEPSACEVGASSFPRRFYIPSVTIRYPFAAG